MPTGAKGLPYVLLLAQSIHILWNIYLTKLIVFFCSKEQVSTLFLKIGYFICLHFKCYPLSQFPLCKPPILLPSPSLYEDAMPPAHLLPAYHPGILLCWGIEPPQDQGPLFPLIPNKLSFAMYVT